MTTTQKRSTHLIDFIGHGTAESIDAVLVRLTPAYIIDRRGERWRRDDGRQPGASPHSYTVADLHTLTSLVCERCGMYYKTPWTLTDGSVHVEPWAQGNRDGSPPRGVSEIDPDVCTHCALPVIAEMEKNEESS